MSDHNTLSFSFISGKGGVGKSNLALNICYGLHLLGFSTLLMDCDMGLANMDVLLGIAPDHHVQDILISNMDTARVLVPIEGGQGAPFDLLPANAGLAEFAELDSGARGILRERLNPVAARYNFFCMDAGAGISSMVLGFSAMTAVRIMVVTPEPTSLTDSYAMMKVLTARHSIKDFYILVNQVESEEEGKSTYKRLSTVCKRFLGYSPAFLGSVRTDKMLTEAVRKQKPLLSVAPASPAAEDCMAAAERVKRLRENLIMLRELGDPLRSLSIENSA
ncbi:MinD/ParA family protein [Desulfovibrio sp. OttesenSCG-928-A18]|nr:MinD/ParA family protein [Desulfovibrio sp. OttesenSCG-928-A18]